MQLDFPYQVVTFLGDEPTANEPVYYGDNGWYPQIAVKRRFNIVDINEADLIQSLKDFFNEQSTITIETGSLVKPDSMPIQVINIANEATLKKLHTAILNFLGETITSRFPDREGTNYFPHVSAQHTDTFVIDVDKYTHKQYSLNNVWLLKDIADENSVAYKKIK